MKNSTLSFLVLSALIFAPTALAHPGHDLAAHGPQHIAASAYHLSIIIGVALLSFLGAALLRKSWACRFQLAGAAALFTGVLLWVAQN